MLKGSLPDPSGVIGNVSIETEVVMLPIVEGIVVMIVDNSCEDIIAMVEDDSFAGIVVVVEGSDVEVVSVL